MTTWREYDDSTSFAQPQQRTFYSSCGQPRQNLAPSQSPRAGFVAAEAVANEAPYQQQPFYNATASDYRVQGEVSRSPQFNFRYPPPDWNIGQQYDNGPECTCYTQFDDKSTGKWFEQFKRIRAAASVIPNKMNDAREDICEAKERFLDWISPQADGYGYPSMPPLPSCNNICSCKQPTRIQLIPDVSCNCCGSPGVRCGACFGISRTCPTCFQPATKGHCILPCRRSPKQEVTPELLVTSVGPFKEKVLLESKRGRWTSDCYDSLRGTAFECGLHIGSFCTCCRKEPPPAPVPGRPIQRLFPGFFPETPPKRLKFPWIFCSPKMQAYTPPRGGLVGVAEDLAVLGVGAAGMAVEAGVDILEQCAGLPESQPAQCRCQCPPPTLRYPTNGVYDDPPDAPTSATGWRLLDAVNNFLDALTIPPPTKSALLPEPKTPDTEQTGNPLIDTVNNFLDNILPPEDSPKESPSRPHNPYNALKTYLYEKPKDLKDYDQQTLFPCFDRDATGKSLADKYLPDVCFGEGIHDIDTSSKEIDYVNFNIIPATAKGSLATGARTALPAY